MSGKRYPEEFKIEAVKQVVDRGYSVASVATRLDITTHSLYSWIKKYGPDSSTNKEQLSTPRCLTVMGMRTISWTALSFQPALLAVHFRADCTQR